MGSESSCLGFLLFLLQLGCCFEAVADGSGSRSDVGDVVDSTEGELVLQNAGALRAAIAEHTDTVSESERFARNHGVIWTVYR